MGEVVEDATNEKDPLFGDEGPPSDSDSSDDSSDSEQEGWILNKNKYHNSLNIEWLSNFCNKITFIFTCNLHFPVSGFALVVFLNSNRINEHSGIIFCYICSQSYIFLIMSYLTGF